MDINENNVMDFNGLDTGLAKLFGAPMNYNNIKLKVPDNVPSASATKDPIKLNIPKPSTLKDPIKLNIPKSSNVPSAGAPEPAPAPVHVTGSTQSKAPIIPTKSDEESVDLLGPRKLSGKTNCCIIL